MKVEKGKVRAPEIGRVWLNSSPLSFRQLRGRVVLVDFWDYTCVNCIRTLPYVQAWHERYRDKGLTVIGVHTPEFTFAQYESNVERGIREFGLTYPIVIDSDREIWKAFANRYWPTKYLLDKDGYLRWGHFGEGGYGECEQMIQELLREIDPGILLAGVDGSAARGGPRRRGLLPAFGRTLSGKSPRTHRQRRRIQRRSDCRLRFRWDSGRKFLLRQRTLGFDRRILRSRREPAHTLCS